MVVGDAVAFLLFSVLGYVAYTARTAGLIVILSEAKNFVVAPSRERLIFPLDKLSTPQQFYRKDYRFNCHSEQGVIATPAKNLVVEPARECRIYPLRRHIIKG